MKRLAVTTILFAAVAGYSLGQTSPDTVSRRSAIEILPIHSPYQSGETVLRYLRPNSPPPPDKPRILLLLPVEAGISNRWGDGLREIEQLDLHNKHNLICCQPTFSHLPWYCDHPTDSTIRQESHLLNACLPQIEQKFGKRTANERLLVGFSKSGWGAISLLLRYPDTFGCAAAWDAPFMKTRPDQFGMGPIFGNQSNFEKYQLSKLVSKRAKPFQQSTRIGIFGYGNFRPHHIAFDQLLSDLKIAHLHVDGPQRIHRWDSGWLPDAVAFVTGEVRSTLSSQNQDSW